MRILIVEDEQNVASFLERGLQEAGHTAVVASTGERGLSLLREDSFDALILDLILPGMDGIEVCQTVRTEFGYDIIILMLTALSSTENVVSGLKKGADDYLVKPFKFVELLARLEALERRTIVENISSEVYILGGLEVDNYRRVVKRFGQPIRLTAREYELLLFLIKNEGRIVSRETILAEVWDMDWEVSTNVVDVYINYLRNKVDKGYDPKLIKTVIGMGYVLTKEDVG
jgi:two-component system, OmpR family, copper resistance phosphate regulon response regulator CusR